MLLGLCLAGCTAALPGNSITDLRTRPVWLIQPAGRIAPIPTAPLRLTNFAHTSGIPAPETPVPANTRAILFSKDILNDPVALQQQLPEQTGCGGKLSKRYSSEWDTIIWECDSGQIALWYDKYSGFIYNYSEASGGRLVLLTSPFLGTLEINQTTLDDANAIVEGWCQRSAKSCTSQSRLAILVGSYKEVDFKTFDRMAYILLYFKDNTRGLLQPARILFKSNYIIRYVMGYDAVPTPPEGRRLADLLSIPLQKSNQLPGVTEEGGIQVNDLLARLEMVLRLPGW